MANPFGETNLDDIEITPGVIPEESAAQAAEDAAAAEGPTVNAGAMMGGGIGGGMADPNSWVEAINAAKESWFNLFNQQRQNIAADPCYGAALVGEALHRLVGLRSQIATSITLAEEVAAAEEATGDLFDIDRDAAANALATRLYGWAAMRLGAAFAGPAPVLAWVRARMPAAWPIPRRNPVPVNTGGVNSGIGMALPFGGSQVGAVQIGSGIYFDRTVGELRGIAVHDAMVDAAAAVEATGAAGILAAVLYTQYAEVQERIAYWTAEQDKFMSLCAAWRETDRQDQRFPWLVVAGTLVAIGVLRS